MSTKCHGVVKLTRMRSLITKRRVHLAATVAPLLALVACDNASIRVAAVPVDEFSLRYATLVCESAAECCGADAGTADAGTAGGDGCIGAVRGAIDATFETAGTYRGTTAQDCLDLRDAQQGCDRVEPAALCDDVAGTPLLPSGLPPAACDGDGLN